MVDLNKSYEEFIIEEEILNEGFKNINIGKFFKFIISKILSIVDKFINDIKAFLKKNKNKNGLKKKAEESYVDREDGEIIIKNIMTCKPDAKMYENLIRYINDLFGTYNEMNYNLNETKSFDMSYADKIEKLCSLINDIYDSHRFTQDITETQLGEMDDVFLQLAGFVDFLDDYRNDLEYTMNGLINKEFKINREISESDMKKLQDTINKVCIAFTNARKVFANYFKDYNKLGEMIYHYKDKNKIKESVEVYIEESFMKCLYIED